MILKTDANRPDPDVIQAAVQTLVRGKLVVMPTDTVYGLAVDLRVPGAREQLIRAKGRSPAKPLARLASCMEDVSACGVSWTPQTRRLAEHFWPGALTLVLPCAGKTVGFRIPGHKTALAVLRATGAALAVSSANLSGGRDPLTAEDALQNLHGHVALAIDTGPAPGGMASTVVRVKIEELEVLREGAIDRAELLEVWNKA